jgi:Tfp pilus assembly protein PilO
MTRVGWLLTTMLCILLGVGWYFLLFSPTSDEIADVRAETERVQTEATQQRARAAQLREIRLNAPEAEAALNAGQLIIPEEPAIPALFRQMQQAADDAGVRLLSINPAAPSVVTINGQDVASIGVSMTLQGSYFQMVDLARRIEDPLLTPRALRWDAAALSPSDFPELSVTYSGQVYSRGVEQLPTMEEPPQEVTPDEAGDAGDPDADELDEVTP